MKIMTSTREAGKGFEGEFDVRAVVYGPKFESTCVTINEGDFLRLYRKTGHTALCSVVMSDKNIDALVQDVQINPVTRKIIHVDFFAPAMDKEVNVSVPLVFMGDAPAVVLGALFTPLQNEVGVVCMPNNIPQHIDIDISGLEKVGDSLYFSDVVLPKNVRFDHNVDMKDAICTVVEPKDNVESETVETEVDGDAEGEGKKEEDKKEE